jgi:hypothetical protein
MGAYKSLLSSDIIITPFEVNKAFTFSGSSDFTDIGIDRFLATNTEENNFNTGWDTTGEISQEYQYLIYNSIKELYYSNFIITSASSGTSTAESGSYFNYPQSDLYFRKSFPTEFNGQVGVFSIASKLYGNRIQPKSLRLTSGSNTTITDDGEGNLIYNNAICGNIIYNQGILIITNNGNPDSDGGSLYGEAIYGVNTYGGTLDPNFINNFITERDNITCSFSSSYDIFETQYKCTISANEFNYSLNPSLLSSSIRGQNKILNSGASSYSNYVTSSDFSPFVTTVGLYNDDQELVAVGKLAQPLPTSQTTDTTIFINIDR